MEAVLKRFRNCFYTREGSLVLRAFCGFRHKRVSVSSACNCIASIHASLPALYESVSARFYSVDFCAFRRRKAGYDSNRKYTCGQKRTSK